MKFFTQMRFFAAVGLFFVALGLSTEVRAEEEEPGVIYQKKTVVSFEGDMIDGDLTRPDMGYVESRKRVRHSNLIRIRENWRVQILQSASRL